MKPFLLEAAVLEFLKAKNELWLMEYVFYFCKKSAVSFFPWTLIKIKMKQACKGKLYSLVGLIRGVAWTQRVKGH